MERKEIKEKAIEKIKTRMGCPVFQRRTALSASELLSKTNIAKEIERIQSGK